MLEMAVVKMITASTMPSEEDIAASEECLEEIIGIKLLLIEVVPLLEILLSSMLIINPFLLWVAKTGKGSADLFESIT